MKKTLAAAAFLFAFCTKAFPATVSSFMVNDTTANTLTFNDTFGHNVVVGSYSPVTGLWTATGGNVTSVGISVPSFLAVAGTPVTTSGTIAITASSQAANLVLASPNGSSGAMSPRALTTPDLSTTCPSGQVFYNNAGAIACQAVGGAGTVTSAGLTAPAWLTVGGSPITTAGTFAITSTSEPQNFFLAAPSGATGVMAPRAIVSSDLSTTCSTGQEFYNNAGAVGCQTPNGGTVTSVAMTVPSWLSVAGSPISTSGTFALTTPNQVANTFLASPSGSTGALSARTIVSADIATVLASPPAIGSSAPSTGAFTTLSASGAVSGAGMDTYSAARIAGGLPGAFSTLSASGAVSGSGMDTYSAARIAAGLPGVFSTYTVGAPNMVGDGSTNNNTALQAALTAVASGGFIHLPCGTYKVTAASSVTIASGKRILLEGAGMGCTTIAVSGAVGGLVFSRADETAGVDIKDLAVTTDQAGTQTGIAIQNLNAGTLFGYAAPSSVQNISLYGSDFPNAGNPTKYWAAALTLNNVSNVSIINVYETGGGCISLSCNGAGLNLVGKGSGSYGVVFNVVNSTFNLNSIGISYGDWIQGLSVVNSNFTGNQYGILTATAPAGILSQLSVTNSQFNNLRTNIFANTGGSGSITGVNISNNFFLPEAAGAIQIILRNVNEYAITGNVFSGGLATTTGIEFIANDNSGTMSGNAFLDLVTAVKVDASAVLTNTTFSGNEFKTNTTDYSVGAGSSGFVIWDQKLRTIAGLFSCIAGDNSSRAYVSDTVGAAAPTYHLTVAGGGATTVNSPVYCDGANWKYD